MLSQKLGSRILSQSHTQLARVRSITCGYTECCNKGFAQKITILYCIAHYRVEMTSKRLFVIDLPPNSLWYYDNGVYKELKEATNRNL